MSELIGQWRTTAKLARQYGFEAEAMDWEEAANALDVALAERDQARNEVAHLRRFIRPVDLEAAARAFAGLDQESPQ